MKYLSIVVALVLVFSLGVVSFADGASTSLHVVSSSGGDSSDPAVDPSTNTDISEEVKKYVEDDQAVIFLESGQVVVSADRETSSAVRATSSPSPVGYYVEVDSSIGDILYIPSDYDQGSLYVDGSGLIRGCRASTFSGYIGNYTVRFPSYSSPQYRLTSSSGYYDWTDVDLTFVESPNVEVVGANVLPTSDHGALYIIFGVLGVLVLATFMKH